tara:strand:- start:279 stop:698 length:420 start_codon:yes stop_codon:yes gene_type:complete
MEITSSILRPKKKTLNETKFYKLLKKQSKLEKNFILDRIETTTSLGFPDLIVFNGKSFVIVELKTATNKIRFSPHQIAWFIKHQYGAAFISVYNNKTFQIYLYKAYQIKELVENGLQTKPIFIFEKKDLHLFFTSLFIR